LPLSEAALAAYIFTPTASHVGTGGTAAWLYVHLRLNIDYFHKLKYDRILNIKKKPRFPIRMWRSRMINNLLLLCYANENHKETTSPSDNHKGLSLHHFVPKKKVGTGGTAAW